MTNPEPKEIVTLLQGKSAVGDTDADRPILSDSFEVERGMRRIVLPELEALSGQRLNFGRQGIESLPEVRPGERFQGNFRHSPAWYSLRAFSARWSSLPASASAAIWRSHLSAMYSSN